MFVFILINKRFSTGKGAIFIV